MYIVGNISLSLLTCSSYIWYSSNATSQALLSYSQVTSNLQGHVKSPYSLKEQSKNPLRIVIAQCMDMAGKK